MSRNLLRVQVVAAVLAATALKTQGPAPAALVVDAFLTDTSQIRSATNDPYFGAGKTVNLGAINISYGTPVGAATVNGIGFHDLELNTNPRTGTNIPLANGQPGMTFDFIFDGDADMPGPRYLTANLTGPDATTANLVARGNRYISVTSNHRPNILNFHGALPGQLLYVQLIGGQHNWNGNTWIYVNGDGVTEGSGTNIGLWNSNKTNQTAGLAGFEAVAKPNGDFTLEVRSGYFSGLAAVIVQGAEPPWISSETGANYTYTAATDDLINQGSPSFLAIHNTGGSAYGSDPTGIALINGTIVVFQPKWHSG